MADETHPSSTTIPSEPIPSAPQPAPTTDKPANPPPPQANPTTLQKLRLLLLRRILTTAKKTDTILLRLANLLSTPSGIDVLLCTTSYTLTLLHALLSRLLARKLASIASSLATKADGILMPGETLIAELPAPTSTKLIAQVVGSSKALAGTIADYRIFVRLWGVVGLYTWARATWLDRLPGDASRKEKLLRGLTWASIANCVVFQVLENGAYLSSKGALTSARWSGDVGRARENAWWLWSSRFWAAYVGVELVKLGVEKYYWREGVQSVGVSGAEGEKEDKMAKEESVKQEKLRSWLWWKDLASNVAYAPMTLHWSVEEGILSDVGVGVCGMVAGGALLADAWRKTA